MDCSRAEGWRLRFGDLRPPGPSLRITSYSAFPPTPTSTFSSPKVQCSRPVLSTRQVLDALGPCGLVGACDEVVVVRTGAVWGGSGGEQPLAVSLEGGLGPPCMLSRAEQHPP